MTELDPSIDQTVSLKRQSWKPWRSGRLHAQRLDRLGVMLVVVSAIGFGSLAIFGKLAYAQGLDPLSTLSWRLGGAAAILWVWLLLSRQWRMQRRAAIASVLLGAGVYALQSALFFNALSYASAGVTALLFFTYPAFVALLSWALTRQSLHSWQLQALFFAFIGCGLTVDFGSESAQPLGILLGIAAGGGYAIYLVLSARLVRNAPPLQTAAYMLGGATLAIVGFTLLHQGVMLPTTLESFGALTGLAVVSTALPIVCLYWGLQRLQVVPAAILSMLEPGLSCRHGHRVVGRNPLDRSTVRGCIHYRVCSNAAG